MATSSPKSSFQIACPISIIEDQRNYCTLLYIAGLFGSDGCVRTGGLRLYQSNKAMCEGLSEMISTVSYGKIRSTMSMQKEEGGTNKQNTFHVRFGVNEMGLLALRYGIFDYNRCSQRTLLSMIDTIRLSEGFDEKKDLKKCLRYNSLTPKRRNQVEA